MMKRDEAIARCSPFFFSLVFVTLSISGAALEDASQKTMPGASASTRYRVGQRLSHHHCRGTIRFVGELVPRSEEGTQPPLTHAGVPEEGDKANTKTKGKAKAPLDGVWLGIEWDDAARGKHWGAFQGKQIFECLFHARPDAQESAASGSPSAPSQSSATGPASFLRPDAPGIVTGTSMLHAIKAKYAPQLLLPTSSSGGGATQEGFSPAVEPKAPMSETTEAVGGKKPKYSRRNLAEIELETPDLGKIDAKFARLDRLRVAGLHGSPTFTSSRASSSTSARARESEHQDVEAEDLLVCCGTLPAEGADALALAVPSEYKGYSRCFLERQCSRADVHLFLSLSQISPILT